MKSMPVGSSGKRGLRYITLFIEHALYQQWLQTLRSHSKSCISFKKAYPQAAREPTKTAAQLSPSTQTNLLSMVYKRRNGNSLMKGQTASATARTATATSKPQNRAETWGSARGQLYSIIVRRPAYQQRGGLMKQRHSFRAPKQFSLWQPIDEGTETDFHEHVKTASATCGNVGRVYLNCPLYYTNMPS